MNREHGRKDWLDIAKGIAMISIVYFHINTNFTIINEQADDYFTKLFSSYQVILFFCLAGFTMKEERLAQSKEFLFHKFRTLYGKMIGILIPAVLLHNIFIDLGLYMEGMEYDGKLMFRYSITDFVKQCVFTLFGGCREVMTGPMWFANVLLFAFLVETVLCFVVNRVFKQNQREIRLLACFLLLLGSAFLTNVLHFTIPRGNNTLTAVFLIDLGQYLYFYKKDYFDNKIVLVAAAAMMVILPFYGGVALNSNQFVSPSHLIATTLSSLYVICWISRRIEGNWLGRLVAVIGRYSFYVMGFQFLGFKLGSLLLNLVSGESNHPLYDLIPRADNIVETLYYFGFAMAFSVIAGVMIEKIGNNMKSVRKIEG